MNRLLLGMILAEYLSIAQLSYAAPPEGKGNDKENNGKAVGQEQTPPGQEKKAEADASRAERAAERAEARTERAETRADQSEARVERGETSNRGQATEAKIERQHPHQERGTLDTVDRGSSAGNGQGGQTRLAQAAHAGTGGRGGDHGVRGRETAKAHVDELLKSLNKMEKARWDYNSHDTRGQGNMGKVDMRSPYGFDKDSDREGSERGRPIRETEPETLDLASLITLTWGMTDYYVAGILDYLRLYYYPGGLYSTALEASWAISYFENIIAYYNSLPYISVASNTNDTINYTVNLGDVPTSFEGNTVVVTTTLTSINNYRYSYWTYDTGTKSWIYNLVHYDAGQVVLTQTQEVALSDNGTLAFSYDPPTVMVNYIGGYFELALTVTEPISGSTYTTTYDKQIYLFRCPYGIVYDKQTGKPIVGATVTIHNADGSIAVLDKASNPTVSNPQVTDATGRYNAKLAIGKKYYLTVKVQGYAEYKSPLFSERWHIVREDVGLTPVQPVAQPFSPQGSLPVPLEADEQPPTAPTLELGIGVSVPVGK